MYRRLLVWLPRKRHYTCRPEADKSRAGDLEPGNSQRLPPSLARRLERVIQVGMIPAAPQPRADEPVYRQEQWSPVLELADMGQLMRSAVGQALGVSGQDHMPQRHRCTALVEAAATQEPGDQPS